MNIHEAFDVVGHFGKGQIALIVPACFACYIQKIFKYQGFPIFPDFTRLFHIKNS